MKSKLVGIVSLSLVLSASALADEVGHSCVYGCDSGAPPAASGGYSQPAAAPAPDPIQQGMMNGIQQGLQMGIQNFQEDQRRKEQQRHQMQMQQAIQDENQGRENLQREMTEENARKEQKKNELQNELLPVGGMLGAQGAPPGLPTAFTHPLKKPVIKVDYPNAARRQHDALMCSLAPVFSAGKGLGPEQQKALQSFKHDLGELQKQLAQAPSGDPNAQLVSQPSIDIQTQGPDGPRQLVAHALAVRNEETGGVTLQIQYHSSVNGKTDEGQSVIRTDKYGRTADSEVSHDTQKCLDRIE